MEENILAARQVGKVMVRHLLLPGHLRCCTEPLLKWFREEIPDVDIHLMLDYYPNGCSGIRGLERTLSPEEKREVRAMARDYEINLSGTGFGKMSPTCLSALSDLESRARESFSRQGCHLRGETITIGSDGSLIIPDLSANMLRLLGSESLHARPGK